ncbi:putative aminotransferase aclI [Colletotrichum gloeosporioides]|uniref:Putative aminotransferase aclI n=1 Tax=Colletotrichum gloeosporioides TaxID=474922 RepID=A0A8H4CQ22_COLGL|nr:putative aminotransferase aclI [Colletotrichum gloeosporioides]KAF3808045.1 putative aminotransferase aclI [Colletotrichum gloeosporioides]
MDSGTFLSKRGKQYALPANKNKLLGILGDVWHPVNNPTGYFNMGVAENTLMQKELLEYITAKLTVDGAIFGYGDSFSRSHRLKDVLAAFLTQHFRAVRPIQAADLAITSGVSAAIEACAFTLGDVDDGVLLAQPFYKAFPYNLSNRAGLRPVFVSFLGEDPIGPHSAKQYEQALLGALEQGIKVKAMLLCNPHNPLGWCYPKGSVGRAATDLLEGACASRHTLVSYMKLCQKYNLHIISDEIYGLSCWENPETPEAPGFHSMLSINPHGIINSALDLGMNGFRLGFTSPKKLRLGHQAVKAG